MVADANSEESASALRLNPPSSPPPPHLRCKPQSFPTRCRRSGIPPLDSFPSLRITRRRWRTTSHHPATARQGRRAISATRLHRCRAAADDGVAPRQLAERTLDIFVDDGIDCAFLFLVVGVEIGKVFAGSRIIVADIELSAVGRLINNGHGVLKDALFPAVVL